LNSELAHHGILGMKWGVRKDPKRAGRGKKEGKKEPKDMSDAELQASITRMQREKMYSQLSNEAVKGKSYVGKFIKAGTTVAAVTGAAVGIYGNMGKLKGIVKPVIQKAARMKTRVILGLSPF